MLGDDELRGLLRGLSGQLGDVASEMRAVRNLADEHTKAIGAINRHLHGVTDPPPPDAGAPPAAPLGDLVDVASRQASSTSLELASFEGRVIGELAAIRRELAPQSRALGIGVAGFEWLRTREGKTFVASFAALLFALAGFVAQARGVMLSPSPSPELPPGAVSR